MDLFEANLFNLVEESNGLLGYENKSAMKFCYELRRAMCRLVPEKNVLPNVKLKFTMANLMWLSYISNCNIWLSL